MRRPCSASPGSGGAGSRVRFVDIVGLLVPVRDPRGRIIALKIRRDDSKDGPKYLSITSAEDGGPSPGSPPHVPPGTPAETVNIRLTEGELKADISWKKSGMPTLGVSGVSNWRPCLPILETMGVRAVYVAFDADAWTKAGVGRELAACVDGLTGQASRSASSAGTSRTARASTTCSPRASYRKS